MTAVVPLVAEVPSGPSEAWEVSPGIAGFWAFFGLAVAVVVLGVLVMRQMRRVDQNARLRMAQEAADAKAAELRAAGASAGTGPAASEGSTADGEQVAGDRADPADDVVGGDGEDRGRSAATDQG
ncbi:hypothetical protein CZ771_02725 [Actinomycetales bacterium JB111]|nr:hypothetical protein CZ771_02725 [Actinomycetales bacterium JB111]